MNLIDEITIEIANCNSQIENIRLEMMKSIDESTLNEAIKKIQNNYENYINHKVSNIQKLANAYKTRYELEQKLIKYKEMAQIPDSMYDIKNMLYDIIKKNELLENENIKLKNELCANNSKQIITINEITNTLDKIVEENKLLREKLTHWKNQKQN